MPNSDSDSDSCLMSATVYGTGFAVREIPHQRFLIKTMEINNT